MHLAQLISLCILSLVSAGPLARRDGPTVLLADGSTIVGSTQGSVDTFKGIPYAQPPIGDLRLKPPQPLNASLGVLKATSTPRACPQFFSQAGTGDIISDSLSDLASSPLLQQITDSGEDCLNLNIQRPSSATADSKLPVVFWIYGGGFEFGSTQSYDATELITTAIDNGKDILYVAVNYRVGGFGFLAGREILADGSSNLGLLDQRLGLQWVADNIASFGGDPSRVTLWGESAGAISVFDQMALFDGEYLYKDRPLFRAAVMNSGSIAPANAVDCAKGQAVFDAVVAKAGCSGSGDPLACLRGVPYAKLLTATNSVPAIFGFNSVALSYLPRPDGRTLTASPEVLAAEGKFSKIPVIVGDQEDEGTVFALFQKNLTTTGELEEYLSSIFFTDASREQIQQLVASYPEDPASGSPFGSADSNQLYPQFKRLAALVGDMTFTLTRRIFLQAMNDVSPITPTFSYLNSYGSGTPILGTFHASDIMQLYGSVRTPASATAQKYLISFFHDLDPNTGNEQVLGSVDWPLWMNGKQMLNFNAAGAADLMVDDFRNESFAFLLENQASLRV